MSVDFKKLKNPPAEYRAKPFWALNGALVREELKYQIECMKKMGFGGAFLHARTGLITEYMSDEWLSLLSYAADLLKENGMEAYLYDEDRWPSGTCGGLVTETEEFRAKSMVYDVVKPETYTEPENFLGLFAVVLKNGAVETFRKLGSVSEGREGELLLAFRYLYMHPDTFYNGYTYVDTMYRAATERFIELTHERYKKAMGEKFGKEIFGIFTDEPHRGSLLNGFSRKEAERLIEIPYTYALFGEFYARKGYRVEDRLPVLWFGRAGEPFCKEMYDLIEVEQELFLENFAEPYLAWCRENKLVVTGHVLHEDNLASQTTMCGSVMRYYEYMDIPGMDNLTENNFCYNVPKLVSSVSRQLGRRRTLDELYAATGWKMRLCDYKRTGDWQSAGGISLRCPHLSWYTMKGEAKRDYPASILHQSGWYRDFSVLEDYFARMHYLLGLGSSMTETAILNPVESTWGLTNQYSYQNCFDAVSPLYQKLEADYAGLYRELFLGGVEADYIDEGLLAEHGSVREGRLFCGEAGYSSVVLNGNLNLRNTTLSALKEFLAAGGKLLVTGEFPRYLDGVPHDFSDDLKSAQRCDDFVHARKLLEDDLLGECPLIAVRRKLENGFLLFLLNGPEEEEREVAIRVRTPLPCVALDLRSGEKRHIGFEREGEFVKISRRFARDEELMLLFGEELPPEPPVKEEPAALPSEFEYSLNEPNFLVLDSPELYVDGAPQGKNYILSHDRALRLRFGLETRGNEMIQPWFRRKSADTGRKLCRVEMRYTFEMGRTLPLSLMAEELEHTSVLLNGSPVTGEISRTPVDSCFGVLALPEELLVVGKNELSLSFDFCEERDLEGIFLCGDFGVAEGDRIVGLPKLLHAGDFRTQGLPYYGGSVVLYAKAENGRYLVETQDLDCALMKVNGNPVAFPPFRTETEVTDGALAIELVFTRNNLFGCSDGEGKHSLLRAQGLRPLSLKRLSR